MRNLLTLALFTLIAGCQPAPEPMSRYWKNWGDNQLSQWQASSDALLAETANYCAGNASLSQLQGEWRNVFQIWSATNGYPYKGVADLALEFELYFWPDKRNRIEGQLRQRLAEGALATTETLQSRIAAEKGLAALEWLLFAADTDLQTRCQLLPASAADYHNKVLQVAEYDVLNPVVQDAWLTTGSTTQSNSISLNLLFAQITALSSRLSNSLDEEFNWLANDAYGWRSDSTLASFTTSLNSLLDHLQYLSERPELAAETRTRLVILLAQGGNLREQMRAGDSPTESLTNWLEEVENLLQSRISRDFDVLIGFNNFDGD